MLLSLKMNNCLIYNSEVEFSMRADRHYKRFPENVASINGVHALKSAILLGPNNTGKTKFVEIIAMLKDILLGARRRLIGNLFYDNPIIEISVSFLENGEEYLFGIKYNDTDEEYIYERFAEIHRDKYGNMKIKDIYYRDLISKKYYSLDEGLDLAMENAPRDLILIHGIFAKKYPFLMKAKESIVSFASRIDIVDVDNIMKTVDMMRSGKEMQQKIANFILNADLCLDDYRLLNDDELSEMLGKYGIKDLPLQNIDSSKGLDMLRLASVYKGVMFPSYLYDSKGTKKMATLSSYVIDALENGRIIIVDELDSGLHFRLTRAIIAMFNNEFNYNAQMIATVHDISLLDCKKLFRKEQIWFTYKDSEDVYLYSLADFTAGKNGVRDTSDLIEKYRKGVFGAVPEPELFRSLLEVHKNVKAS